MSPLCSAGPRQVQVAGCLILELLLSSKPHDICEHPIDCFN